MNTKIRHQQHADNGVLPVDMPVDCSDGNGKLLGQLQRSCAIVEHELDLLDLCGRQLEIPLWAPLELGKIAFCNQPVASDLLGR